MVAFLQAIHNFFHRLSRGLRVRPTAAGNLFRGFHNPLKNKGKNPRLPRVLCHHSPNQCEAGAGAAGRGASTSADGGGAGTPDLTLYASITCLVILLAVLAKSTG